MVLTMRADFYARCAAYAELSALIAANQFLVSPMDITRTTACYIVARVWPRQWNGASATSPNSILWKEIF